MKSRVWRFLFLHTPALDWISFFTTIARFSSEIGWAERVSLRVVIKQQHAQSLTASVAAGRLQLGLHRLILRLQLGKLQNKLLVLRLALQLRRLSVSLLDLRREELDLGFGALQLSDQFVALLC